MRPRIESVSPIPGVYAFRTKVMVTFISLYKAYKDLRKEQKKQRPRGREVTEKIMTEATSVGLVVLPV